MPEAVVDHHLQRIQRRVVAAHTLGILCHHLAHERCRGVHILGDHSPSNIVICDDAGQAAVRIQQQSRIGPASGHPLGHFQDRTVVGDGHWSFGSQFRDRPLDFIRHLALRMEWRVHGRHRANSLWPRRLACDLFFRFRAHQLITDLDRFKILFFDYFFRYFVYSRLFGRFRLFSWWTCFFFLFMLLLLHFL